MWIVTLTSTEYPLLLFIGFDLMFTLCENMLTTPSWFGLGVPLHRILFSIFWFLVYGFLFVLNVFLGFHSHFVLCVPPQIKETISFAYLTNIPFAYFALLNKFLQADFTKDFCHIEGLLWLPSGQIAKLTTQFFLEERGVYSCHQGLVTNCSFYEASAP